MRWLFDLVEKNGWLGKIIVFHFIVKIAPDAGTDDDKTTEKQTMPFLGAFVLSDSKETLNKVMFANDGFQNKTVCFADTDSL